MRGDLGDLAFGAAFRNGLVRPWALGPRPGVHLADNPQLMGSASWSGRLLGLTPSGRSVAGAAGLAVDLDSLSGDLDFTSLESWSGAPGESGSGAMWGDGDLNYDVAVRGNVFARTGGDEGLVTGAFFGASHEGMGGTLVRDDLSAGFGRHTLDGDMGPRFAMRWARHRPRRGSRRRAASTLWTDIGNEPRIGDGHLEPSLRVRIAVREGCFRKP